MGIQTFQEQNPAKAGFVRLKIDPEPMGSFFFDPAFASLESGEALPLPFLVRVRPGRFGTPANGDSTNTYAYQLRNGKTQVPLDFECEAWGEKVTGYMTRTKVAETHDGKDVWHYHDVWTRYAVLGSTVVPEIDYDGWLKFRRDIRDRMIGKLHPSTEQAAEAKAQSIIDTLRTSNSPAGIREAERIEKHLPKASSPPTVSAKK
jgi:hypothetical protein